MALDASQTAHHQFTSLSSEKNTVKRTPSSTLYLAR